MPTLFEPFTLKGVTLRNRIVASPMCQYQARDGFLNEWHQPHYAMLARGGAGLVVVEATAVAPNGRITLGDAGLWSDAHVEGFASVVRSIKAAGAVPCIQLAHAGAKRVARHRGRAALRSRSPTPGRGSPWHRARYRSWPPNRTCRDR